MKIFRLLLVVVHMFFLISCANATEPLLNTAEHQKDSLQKILVETSENLNAPGAVLYVRFADGSVWNEAYGNAKIDKETPKQMTTDMQFRIGSVTKTFIGTAILQLVGDGKFNLDDEIENLLPGVIDYAEIITVKMLLNHSSAIPDYAVTEDFTEKYVSDFTYNWGAAELFNFIKGEELFDVPGHESYYSNSNYYLLGMLVEKFSGKSLPQYLQEYIFDPLGLKNTCFPIDNDLHGEYSDGYFDYNENGIFESDEKVTTQNPSAIWSAGMIVSDVSDLSIWIKELLEGKLIKPELQSIRMDMNKQLHGAPDFVKMGLGIACIDGAVGHTGAIPGYTTILFNYKGSDIIAYSNCFHMKEGMGSVAERLLDAVKTRIFK